jgi:hypothetical protein
MIFFERENPHLNIYINKKAQKPGFLQQRQGAETENKGGGEEI